MQKCFAISQEVKILVQKKSSGGGTGQGNTNVKLYLSTHLTVIIRPVLPYELQQQQQQQQQKTLFIP